MTELAVGSPQMTMLAIWGIGMPEMIVIAIIVLLLFGNRLPSVMKSLGQSITEFKKGTREGAGGMHDSVGRQLADHHPHDIDVAFRAMRPEARGTEIPRGGDMARL